MELKIVTLIRTDKYGIQVKKDITATGKDDNGEWLYRKWKYSFTLKWWNSTILNNYNAITIGKGYTKTVGMAATGL